MNLTVHGTGYLGAVHAACLAELGFEVLGTDIDQGRIAALSQGRAPFSEPGLDRLLRRGLRSGRLRFTTSLPEAARFGDVHFLCVGTPQRSGHPGADLSQLYACVDALAPLLRRPCLVAGKSTTPVGTAAWPPRSRSSTRWPRCAKRPGQIPRSWPTYSAATPASAPKGCGPGSASAAGACNVLDTRHALDPARWRAAGWTYRALGRP